jgi:cell division protein FtsI/penicillin-binding protein 2
MACALSSTLTFASRDVLAAPPAAPAAAPAIARRKLAVDPALQAEAARILDETRAPAGAVVVSDVRTGRILVWASKGAVDHVKTPVAPSASLFKVVTAATLLELGRVGLETRQCYGGGGEHGIADDDLALSVPTRACVPFVEALGRSINLVFARLALRYLAPQELRETAARLGFFAPVPIDADVPANDVTIPTEPSRFARAAAGFWNGRLSPLGALFVMQTIANRGERVRLRRSEEQGVPIEREVLGPALKPATADALRRMLEQTTRVGTCAKVFRNEDGTRALDGMPIAAKTGTLIGDAPPRMYSWFAGFAPSRAPEIAVAVLLVDDVHWWMKANAAARRVHEAYFRDRARP